MSAEKVFDKRKSMAVRFPGGRWLWLVVLFLLPIHENHAAHVPLNLTSDFPDFFIDIDGTGSNIFDFDASTSTLTVNGTVSQYTEVDGGFTTSIISSNSFTLTAVFGTSDCPGPTCTASTLFGDFTIDGQVRESSSPFSVIYDGLLNADGLLSGDLIDFGWAATSDTTGILEFVFGNASGVIAEDLLTQGGAGPYSGGGIILNVASSDIAVITDYFHDNLLSTNWTGSGTGDVSVSAIPIPGAMWLFASGVIGLFSVAAKQRIGK